jgi:NitT/TauT family transport system permease protein
VIKVAQNNFDPNGVFGAMLIIAVVTLTAEGILALVERRLLAWRPSPAAEARGI